MASWHLIDSGVLFPEEVMAIDEQLLHQMDQYHQPILHFYEWKVPSLTYGYFTDLGKHLRLEALKENGVYSARRPTGGGIIFHLSDFAFSILLPATYPHFSLNPLDNYAYINQRVAKAIASFNSFANSPNLLEQDFSYEKNSSQAFCMANGTKYDLIIDGKKVGGAAQRRTKGGVLHQGSISLQEPPIDLLHKLLKNSEPIIEAMKKNGFYFLPERATKQELYEKKERLKQLLLREFLKTVNKSYE